MDDLNADLSLILDEDTDHLVYSTATNAIFRRLSREYAAKKSVNGRQILVITSAADFDCVAIPVANELKALGASVKFGCVCYSWYNWQDRAPSADWRATYREHFNNSDFDIVVVSSVINEPNELITIAKAAVTDNSCWDERPLDYASISFIVAAMAPGTREALEGDTDLKGEADERVWVVGKEEGDISCSGPVSPSMKRAGVVDTFRSGHIFPQHILSIPFGSSGRWEGSRPTRPGWISGEEDMLHDIEEMDRRDAGVLTDVKRDVINLAAKILGYTASDEKGVASLSSMYGLSVEDVKRALGDRKPEKSES
jgi:hypothetical protein